MEKIRIRPATKADCGKIVYFVRELARYEKEPRETVKLTEEIVRRDGFGPHRFFEVLIAEIGGEAVGFALFFTNYSTWEGKPGIYIEDLFVEESARRSGAGRKLIAMVAKIARKRGCGKINLSMLEWNPARGFYTRLGFRHLEIWQTFRLSGSELAFAAGSDGSCGAVAGEPFTNFLFAAWIS